MPVLDQCYYCKGYFPADTIFAHEAACSSNPNR